MVKKLELSNDEKIARLSWELLEHKLIYYYGIPSKYLHVEDISNEEYDAKEAEYVKLRRELDSEYTYDVLDFPWHTPSGRAVISFAVDTYIKEHGTNPDWKILTYL